MRRVVFAALLLLLSGCTLHYSKQALYEAVDPSPDATFVSEEDSGLFILSLFQVSEPDHFAVLLARAKKRYRCSKIHSIQLDYYSEIWLIVSFPIARITAICEPEGAAPPPAPPPAEPSPPPVSTSTST